MGGDEKHRGWGEKNRWKSDPLVLRGDVGRPGAPHTRVPTVASSPVTPPSTGVNRAWVIVWQSRARSVTP